jgi:hypothetical protein
MATSEEVNPLVRDPGISPASAEVMANLLQASEAKLQKVYELVHGMSFSAPEVRARAGTHLYDELCEILEFE